MLLLKHFWEYNYLIFPRDNILRCIIAPFGMFLQLEIYIIYICNNVLAYVIDLCIFSDHQSVIFTHMYTKRIFMTPLCHKTIMLRHAFGFNFTGLQTLMQVEKILLCSGVRNKFVSEPKCSRDRWFLSRYFTSTTTVLWEVFHLLA